MIVFILFLSLLSCSKIDIGKTISSEFMKSLNSRQLCESFTPNCKFFQVQNNNEPNDSTLSSIAMLPTQILAFIFTFIDYKSSKSFLEVSKTFNLVAKQCIHDRLTFFSQYFYFNDERLNHLLFCELGCYFRFDTKFSDSDVYDQYESACLEDRSCLTKVHIKYLIKLFIHESLYGSDSPVPINETQWKVFLLLKVSIDFEKYPNSLERLVAINRQIINSEFNNQTDISSIENYLDLIINFITTSNMTPEKFEVFEREIDLLNLKPIYFNVSFHKEFELLKLFLFHEILITDEIALSTVKKLMSSGISSQSLFDRAVHNEEIAISLLKDPRFFRNRIFLKYFFDKFIFNSTRNLWTRNPIYQVTLEDIERVSLFRLVSVSNPSLLILETILNFIRMGIHNFGFINIGDSIISCAYDHGHDSIFEIILHESPDQKVNLFHRSRFCSKLANIFNIGVLKHSKLEIYIKYLLIKADPLPLLFIEPIRLLPFKELICGKFNLNKRYLIDFISFDFILKNLFTLKLFRNGEILSFKEIVEILRIPDLLDLFTSESSNSLDNLSEEESVKVISIKNFITTASFE